MEEISAHSSLPPKNVRPIAIISQLLQNVAGIHHIDDLLGWVANELLQQLAMVTVQVWAVQAYTGGAMRRRLRASASWETAVTEEVVDSPEAGILIDRVLREQRGMLSIPVVKALPQHRANRFVQYNCRYWTVYFLQKDILLPPARGNAYAEEVATPLQMAFSFFTSEPLQESQARAINFLIEQSLRIAMSKGLFSPTSASPGKSEGTMESFVAALVPERIQATEIEQAENPFRSAVVISDKRTRQIYNLIDGKKNIAELMAFTTHTHQKEILEILQTLIVQGHVMIREPGGNSVDISSFL